MSEPEAPEVMCKHCSYLACGAACLADNHNARLIRRERYRTLSHRSMPLRGGDANTGRSFRAIANLRNIKSRTACRKRMNTLKATNHTWVPLSGIRANVISAVNGLTADRGVPPRLCHGPA